MNFILPIVIAIIIGYLLGSISNGILIGKLFFNVDVRTLGSKNAGGTNTGRVLGKKVGLLTIVLDILKTVLSIWIVLFICKINAVNDLLNESLSPSILAYISGFFACIGHMFPLYFGFKGGKVVSCFGGLLLATNWIIFVFGLLFYIVFLYFVKYVSLTSIVASIVLAILSLIPFIANNGMIFSLEPGIYYTILLSLTAVLLIIRHIPNIKRLINHTESKITWM